ncbi:GNAT family N-acetyltransferase [Mangrovihabitans endophyticus]|uniref:N-acetyltransferase n=1 Tax=Mangrovihabitans endophyticus TaxID=1751298 RepID=A0A8J3C5N1_9ACTN|nr:GNAT family N-acetyltransferase [Mangrovihabitans endophyticus]GGL21331.1 N-acetyltransferase [Mangrovihabitans endophyticus]
MTEPATVTVRYGTTRDEDTVTRLLADGFLHGDFGPWLIPDVRDRASVYPAYFRIFAAHALKAGWVELASDENAVAVWYPLGADAALSIPGYNEQLAVAVGTFLPRFQALDTAMHNHHPTGRAHHYLAFLAVRPDQQNRGLGTALLRNHHRYLDARGVPAYLEATGLNNQRLYQRHDYHPREIYHPSPDSPPLHPMWREPHPRPRRSRE